jgi:hypothetical protein
MVVTEAPLSPMTLRSYLRDGTKMVVREAVVRPDSIVGLSSSAASWRVAVARTEVEGIDVSQTDKSRTAGS